MKPLIPFATAALIASAAAGAQTAKDVIRLHNKAIGGERLWHSIKTVRIEQEKEIKAMKKMLDSAGSMAMPTVSIKETLTYINGKGYRDETKTMGMTIYAIVTPRISYTCVPSGEDDKPVKLDSTVNTNPGSIAKAVYYTDPLMREVAMKNPVTFEGIEDLDGKKVYRLNAAESATDTASYYIDAATGYTLRVVLHSLGKTNGFTDNFSNFQTLANGMVIPMLEDNDFMKTTITAVQLNAEIEEDILKPDIPKGAVE